MRHTNSLSFQIVYVIFLCVQLTTMKITKLWVGDKTDILSLMNGDYLRQLFIPSSTTRNTMVRYIFDSEMKGGAMLLWGPLSVAFYCRASFLSIALQKLSPLPYSYPAPVKLSVEASKFSLLKSFGRNK